MRRERTLGSQTVGYDFWRRVCWWLSPLGTEPKPKPAPRYDTKLKSLTMSTSLGDPNVVFVATTSTHRHTFTAGRVDVQVEYLEDDTEPPSPVSDDQEPNQ